MPNFLERAIEKLIGDGIITEEELQAVIASEKEKSPLIPMREDDAYLFFDSMAKDFKIAELEKANADLTFLVMMGGM